jgi:broad specificity phosphatase PhoE
LRLTGIEFVAVYSSPMERALRTAEIAGFASPRVTPLLREYDYGAYEGITTKEIHKTRPDWELFKDGCPDGESPEQAYARAREFIELVARHEGKVLAFAHGHILRTIAVAWIAGDIRVATNLALDVATLSILEEGDHGRVLKVWNSP